MELPIQLKFFKKIDLYQEYKYEGRKVRVSGTRLQDWKIEKTILKWTANNHHHLGSPLTNDGVAKDILKNKYSYEHLHAIESLIHRKYAERKEEGIIITKEGLLMGEVVNEVEGDKVYLKYKNQLKYEIFFWLVWFTAIAGALIVTINFLMLLYNKLGSFFLWILFQNFH